LAWSISNNDIGIDFPADAPRLCVRIKADKADQLSSLAGGELGAKPASSA
jgi:hypothetical protein